MGEIEIVIDDEKVLSNEDIIAACFKEAVDFSKIDIEHLAYFIIAKSEEN